MAEVPTISEHVPVSDRSKYLREVEEAVVWDDSLVEGGEASSTLYAGWFNVDWLVNLAFCAVRHGYTVREITELSDILKIVGKMGALSTAKVLSGAGYYPVLKRMSNQWAAEGISLHMCPVTMTYRRLTLAMSLLSRRPSEHTAFRSIDDLGKLVDLIDLVFQAQGALDSLTMDPEDTSVAKYMLHRALIWGAKTDPAKSVRPKTNILAVMRLIISDDDQQVGNAAGAWQKECPLSDEPH